MIADLQQQFQEFILRTKAEIIDTAALPAGPVFEKYFATEPPFGTGNKKSEFPDAFAINGLVEWTNNNPEPLYVISGDKPFWDACQPHKKLYGYARLSTLLNRIIFADAVAGFIRDEILERIDDI